mmetsp:Transcript_3255/g.9838  ORF Transcript_3255/g.9838 Transcript_3255/m.9838 type:complete len:279 (-) Transcript_3255:254-1090(-)
MVPSRQHAPGVAAMPRRSKGSSGTRSMRPCESCGANDELSVWSSSHGSQRSSHSSESGGASSPSSSASSSTAFSGSDSRAGRGLGGSSETTKLVTLPARASRSARSRFCSSSADVFWKNAAAFASSARLLPAGGGGSAAAARRPSKPVGVDDAAPSSAAAGASDSASALSRDVAAAASGHGAAAHAPRAAQRAWGADGLVSNGCAPLSCLEGEPITVGAAAAAAPTTPLELWSILEQAPAGHGALSIRVDLPRSSIERSAKNVDKIRAGASRVEAKKL